MAWWIWVAMGFMLLVWEMIIPSGFFLFLFGIAALIVGLIVGADIGIVWWLQWVIFVVLALALAVAFAKRLQQMMASKEKPEGSQTVGAVIVISGDIPAGGVGNAELWGTRWRVKNLTNESLKAGSSATVSAVEGVTLVIK